MDPSKLSNYIVIKSFSDNQRSLLDCIMPFVEYAIAKSESQYIEVSYIQTFIETNCLLHVPLETIITLLKRLRKDKKIIDYDHWKIILCTDKTTFSSVQYEDDIQAFTRDVNKFLEDCKAYCHFEEDNSGIAELINSFMNLYQHNIDVKEGEITSNLEFTEEKYKRIADFVDYISQTDNTDYNTFKSLFYGYILGQFVTAGKNFDKAKIPVVTVYIDTDFLLRILDMQAECFTVMATELLNLLIDLEFSVIVLPEIIEETKGVLYANYQNFVRDHETLQKLYGIDATKVDGVMGAFFRRGMTVSQIADFIENIETEIKKCSIEISPSGIPSGINTNTYELNKIIESKKKNENFDRIDDSDDKDYLENRICEKATLDEKLLAFIRQKRGKRIFKFQEARCLLLSCDNSIYRINRNYHKHDGSIPECFNEGSLTSLLFMFSPSKIGDVPIKLFTSLFKVSQYVNYNVLTHFHRDVIEYLDHNPDEQQYLTEVFRNQNLFAEISGAYDLNSEENSREMDLIRTLFEQARQNTVEKNEKYSQLLKENQKLTEELKALKVSLENKIIPKLETAPTSQMANQSLVPAQTAQQTPFDNQNNANEQSQKNSRAERILVGAMRIGTGILVAICSVYTFTKIDIKNFAWSIEWWMDAYNTCFFPIFILAFLSFVWKNETVDKITRRVVYDDKTYSIWNIIFGVLRESFIWMFLSIIIPAADKFAN